MDIFSFVERLTRDHEPKWLDTILRYVLGVLGLAFAYRLARPISWALRFFGRSAPALRIQSDVWWLVLLGGLLAWTLNGALWFLFEWRIKSAPAYGPGGMEQPVGMDGIWYGATVSMALAVTPTIMFVLFGYPRLDSEHWRAWVITAIVATPAYLLMFGIKDNWMRGIRRSVIESVWTSSILEKEIIVLFAYTSLICLSTILVYRGLTGSSESVIAQVVRVVVPLCVTFGLGTTYMLIDPAAVEKGSGGSRRGVIVALLLMTSMYSALYGTMEHAPRERMPAGGARGMKPVA